MCSGGTALVTSLQQRCDGSLAKVAHAVPAVARSVLPVHFALAAAFDGLLGRAVGMQGYTSGPPA